MAKLLIVEDDSVLLDELKHHLSAEHYTVDTAQDGDMGLALLNTYQYDIAILDVSMPKKSGFEVCREYRRSGGSARLLMLTGKHSIDDKETGFDCGADDYLTKPFNMRELSARVRALLRRKGEMVADELKAGSLTISPRTFQAFVDGQQIKFTPREFALLEYLVRNPGEVFEPDALLDSIWPSDTEVAKSNIKTYVYRIREKLSGHAGAPVISSVHGVGYRLEII